MHKLNCSLEADFMYEESSGWIGRLDHRVGVVLKSAVFQLVPRKSVHIVQTNLNTKDKDLHHISQLSQVSRTSSTILSAGEKGCSNSSLERKFILPLPYCSTQGWITAAAPGKIIIFTLAIRQMASFQKTLIIIQRSNAVLLEDLLNPVKFTYKIVVKWLI